ncbi:MAG: glucose-1-phosphatase, partial [Schwartzia sp.]|nr:glucose-1-phosphatase [Schwartzia sp. (in: firmicutes)]
MRKMKRNMILLLWLVITLSVSGIAGAERYDAQGVPLRLERVLVLSRHNLRAPLDSGMAVISRLTPHEWFRWTAASGELSLRGGTLETLMGQYYRQWLEQEGLIPRNYVPAENEVRFYANSYQRTIATTQYFSSGMLPIANVRVERHLALNEPDPVFLPGFNGVDDEFVARVMEEIDAAGGTRAIGESLAPEAALVAEVLDYPDSEAARESGLDYFPADDMETVFTGDYFAIRGSLRPAMRAADALVLQ